MMILFIVVSVRVPSEKQNQEEMSPYNMKEFAAGV